MSAEPLDTARRKLFASVDPTLPSLRRRLRINEVESSVALVVQRQFLGFAGWYGPGNQAKHRVVPKALRAMKDRVRSITRRNRGRSLHQAVEVVRAYIAGWKQDFQVAETPRAFEDLDGWVRH